MTKGDKSFELTSNDKGIALSDSLELGEYNITEIKAPEGYKVTDEVFTVNVTTNGGILTIKNTKEKPLEPTKPVEPNKPEEPKKPEQPNKPEEPKNTEPNKPVEPSKPEEPTKPEPKKPDVPNVEQPKKPEEPKNSETPKVEEPKKDTPEIKKPEPPKPVEHSTPVLTNTDKNSTQKEQAQTVKKDVPNTGDNDDIVFYSMLLMFTTAMIVRFKKKNN